MLIKRTLFKAVAAGVAVQPALAKTVIQWGTCADDFGAPGPVDCGRLFVPLDYTEPTGETLSLELLRSPATQKPELGSILINFGGPGLPCRQTLAVLAELLHMLTGGHHNLITFDPRGTGSTIPLQCLETKLEKVLAVLDFSRLPRVEDRAGLGSFWARGKILTEQCGRRQNKTGELIGTAFTARDMMSVAEALGEDGFLRYWGFSYGTTLGATLVSMFPDKVERVVLDGVQNPHEYYHAYADKEEWSDSDEEFSHIFQHCAANPDQCALAREGVTAEELEQSVWSLLERLTYDPVTVGDYILNRDVLAASITNSLYNYLSWPTLTHVLDILINGGGDDEMTFLLKELVGFDPDTWDSLVDSGIQVQQSLIGIHCGDRAARAGSLEALMPTLRELANVSRVLDGVPDGINIPCAQWKFQPKERYEGNFQVATRKPVLIVGNTWDGLTPVRSARNVSSGFEGSVVLEVNGYGHASIGLPSACTLRATRAYWQNGTMPDEGTVCKVDAPPFSNITWEDVRRDVDAEAENVGYDEDDDDDDGFVNLELRSTKETTASVNKAAEHWANLGRKKLQWRLMGAHMV